MRFLTPLIVLLGFACLIPSSWAAPTCPLSTTDRTVTVCSPAANTTVTSPFRLNAGTTSAKPVLKIENFLDGKNVYTVAANSEDTQLTASAGTHRLVVRAWDSSTTYFQTVVNFTVAASGGGGGCVMSSTDRTVTICSPASGSTVTSPFTLSAGTTSSKPVLKMENFLDGKNVYTAQGGVENTQLSAASGQHKLTVRAWDSSTTYFQNTIYFTVGTSGGGGSSPLTFSASSLAFPGQIVGTTSVAQRVTVTNTSGTGVPIGSISISGADFNQLQNCGIQLPAGRSCEINVRFDPKISGTLNGALTISYTGIGSPKTVSLSGSGLAQAKPAIPINHIIWMMQENRDFDSYFGKLNDYRASLGLPTNVDGIPTAGFTNADPGGRLVSSFHFQTMCIENVTPSWNESHYDVYTRDGSQDIGMMDGFVNQAAGYASYNGLFDQRGVRAMGYYTSADLPYHYFMATQFATSDRFFSPLPASTPPNRLYALGASSFGTTAPPTHTFTQPNIFQRLEDAGISWKIYYTDTDSTGQGLSRIWSFQPWASQHAAKIVPMSQYFTDLNNGTLPQVALLESGYGSGRDEHPGGTINGSPNTGNQVQRGVAYAASLINALMKSSSWKDSVLFFTFDEGGGFFDHVVPPFNAVPPDDIQPNDLTTSSVVDGFDRYGFRLPFYVVSPYAKKHYVSHTPADLTAILRFIEERFNVAPLTRRDAAQPDMREFFDFANPSWATPPTPPTQPTNGACNYTNIPE